MAKTNWKRLTKENAERLNMEYGLTLEVNSQFAPTHITVFIGKGSVLFYESNWRLALERLKSFERGLLVGFQNAQRIAYVKAAQRTKLKAYADFLKRKIDGMELQL